jgi:hypothetical protein
MVHSSTLAITTDGKHLACGSFPLGETVRFRSLEINIDCFGGLSLSPKGSDSGDVFMGMTRSWLPSLWTILEDSTNEFYMASSGEGSSGLPVSRRHSTGTSPAPIATAPWSEGAPASLSLGGELRPPCLSEAQQGDSTDEFYVASSREGSSSLPDSQRHSMGTSPAPITTAPWSEGAPTPQTMMMVPSWTVVPRSDTGFPLEG